jgi:hypothetical protein
VVGVGPSGDQAIKAREELTYCRVLKIVAVSLLIASVNFAIAQEKRRPSPSLASSNQSDAWKIENALSAGPKYITDCA